MGATDFASMLPKAQAAPAPLSGLMDAPAPTASPYDNESFMQGLQASRGDVDRKSVV